MDTLSGLAYMTNCSSCCSFARFFPDFRPQGQRPPPPRRIPTFFVLKVSSRSVSESVEEDALEMFFEDRKVNGDFISKASDMLWQREVLKVGDADVSQPAEVTQQVEQVMGSDDDGGFLKLSRTQEWLLGDNSAPVNKKAMAKVLRDDSERRKKLNLLKYEALKRELTLLSVGIGTACSGYCLIVLSAQAAVSYAVGVLFSCLYLQLLYQHVDNLSKEMVPQIFLLKKLKKIGIRSEDLQDFFERSIKGSGIALSSPRLVIPAAIYGLWILSHKFFANDFFDFQIVPAMVGMFAYKAAALVQVYRDNEDLQFVFPENEEQYPVYFAFENDEIDTVLADIKKNDAIGQPATATSGRYKLLIPTPEPRKVASPTITNIQGWLSGLKADGDANQLPTIAIAASYGSSALADHTVEVTVQHESLEGIFTFYEL